MKNKGVQLHDKYKYKLKLQGLRFIKNFETHEIQLVQTNLKS